MASQGVAARAISGKSGPVNIHDWIDELCDVLEIEEAEVDEGLILDLARTSAHQVERVAAPVTTYLLGLAAKAQALAEGWDRPADAPDPDDVDDPIPDDSTVDHSTDEFVR